jgi:glycosyltransferase involved in cell wall biosynthesis
VEEVLRTARDKGLTSGEVQLLGRVSGQVLPLLYAHADIFAYVSLAEGFGFPVLEAFSAGVPVLAANTGSLPEVAGDAALLVDPLDETEMASALGRLASDANLRRTLVYAGRERLRRFSWTQTAAATVAFYREVLNRCPAYVA